VPTTLPPTTEAPTTTLDPVDEVMSELAPLFATANPAGRDLFAKGSPAFLYYDALVLLRQLTSFPDSGASTINGGIRTSDGIVLDEVALNERGQIVNMNRKGPPNPPPQPDPRLRSARGVALRLSPMAPTTGSPRCTGGRAAPAARSLDVEDAELCADHRYR